MTYAELIEAGFESLGSVTYVSSGSTIDEKYPDFGPDVSPQFSVSITDSDGEVNSFTIQMKLNIVTERLMFNLVDDSESNRIALEPLIENTNLLAGHFSSGAQLYWLNHTLYFKDAK